MGLAGSCPSTYIIGGHRVFKFALFLNVRSNSTKKADAIDACDRAKARRAGNQFRFQSQLDYEH